MAQIAPQRRTFVLLFDGTGNKFSGTDSDSNILKILRMLDRNDTRQVHYYQPGIGTYVHSTNYSHTSLIKRAGSWIKKARDAAIGASFDVHVMGGYKFLMRYYQPGDDLYIFGFSRGAYTARYLAEMLDYVGLLEAGNEELARFAWKAFEKWQRRLENNEEDKQAKKEMFDFMKSFRDTFARPIKRVRFLGLFDTVNSVSQFESRWLTRNKHPYTATSSAIVVRHAVSIDERRAKFRQDLLGVGKGNPDKSRRKPNVKLNGETRDTKKSQMEDEAGISNPRFRRQSVAQRSRSMDRGRRGLSPSRSLNTVQEDNASATSASYSISPTRRIAAIDFEDPLAEEERDEALPQDILEVWFSGGHGDIGGGWTAKEDEVLLSHIPLVWMVREAQRAGLRFDPEKLVEMKCGWDVSSNGEIDSGFPTAAGLPSFQITGTDSPGDQSEGHKGHFHKHIHRAATEATVHDCLSYGGGLGFTAVSAWNFMEYLPFRRMDLQPDSTWRSIRYPLPMRETRDIPQDAIIHCSVIRRMEANENYRPGNLIVGGGGRGVKIAPKELGMGEWEIVREPGEPIGECYKRKNKTSVNGKKEK